MGRYAKGVENVDHYYQPDDLYKYAGEPFDVRVSILDEPPDGALFVQVPEDNISRPIGDILDELVIGATFEQTEFIRENLLDLEEFPYLSDALDWVSDIWHRFRAGDADLNICVNNGPDDISLEDTPREHMCTCVWRDGSYDYMLLDLVFEPGELTLLGMLGERKQEMLQWMKGLIALYKLDIDPSSERHLRKKEELEEAREQLFFHNLVSAGPRGKLSITQQGRRAIGRVLDERDELIERFDIYRDVVVRRTHEGEIVADFATLSGADYRVAVYEHEGIDPYRAVFLLSLLSGDLDEELEGKKWLKVINDERFYEELLAPVVDHAKLGTEELDAVVAQGRQYLSRTTAQRQRAGYSQQVLERAKTIQAFPRPKGHTDKADKGKRRAFTRASESSGPEEPEDVTSSPGPELDQADEFDARPSSPPAPLGSAGQTVAGQMFPPPPVAPRTRRFVGARTAGSAAATTPQRRRGFVGAAKPTGAPTPTKTRRDDDDDGWL